MRFINRGKRAVDLTGTPGFPAELRPADGNALVKVGGVIEADALTDNLRRLGFAPMTGGDIGQGAVDAAALRVELDGTETELEATRAAEAALKGRVESLRGELVKAKAKAERADAEAQAQRLKAEQAGRERDALADRLASPGGDAGRPWLDPEHDDARVALVNAWRAETEADARPYKAPVYADAWLYRQGDPVVAERWAAYLEAQS